MLDFSDVEEKKRITDRVKGGRKKETVGGRATTI
jgi:hypothetical protein